MRDESNIASQVRQILLDIEELKAPQFIGTDQLNMYETTIDTGQFGVLLLGRANLRIKADISGRNNILITSCNPEIYKNGARFIPTASVNGRMRKIEVSDPTVNAYSVFLQSDSPIKEDKFRVVFHITSLTPIEKLTLTINTQH